LRTDWIVTLAICARVKAAPARDGAKYRQRRTPSP